MSRKLIFRDYHGNNHVIEEYRHVPGVKYPIPAVWGKSGFFKKANVMWKVWFTAFGTTSSRSGYMSGPNMTFWNVQTDHVQVFFNDGISVSGSANGYTAHKAW